MPKFLTIAGKDLRVWTRDTAALGVLLGMPMVLIFILGSAFGGLTGEGGIDAKVAIVNLDSGGSGLSNEQAADPAAGAAGTGSATDVGAEIVSGLVDNETIADIFTIEERDDATAVRTEVERGELIAALVIPEDFTDSINAGDPVDLEVYKDPGSELSAGIWESIVRSFAADISRISIVAQTAGQVAGESGLPPEMIGAVVGTAIERATSGAAERPIEIEQRTQAKETSSEIAGMDFYALSMTSMFLVFGAMFGAFGFVTERRDKTMSRLLTTPTARAEFIGGKMSGVFLLGVVQFAILYSFTRFAFNVNWGDDPVATFAVATAMVFAVTGLAVLIASLVRSERGAGGVGSIIVQLMALIGGVFFPISILPEWVQPIRYASIMGWGIEGFQQIQIHGGGLPEVTVPILALAGMGVAFFAFGVWRLGAE